MKGGGPVSKVVLEKRASYILEVAL